MGWSIKLPVVLCALLASGLAAQEPAADDQAIIVTGTPDGPSRKEVYDQALDLSRIDPRPHSIYQYPLARFERPVCPAVSGLRGDLADEIAGRIRANAERLKVKLAGPHCSPNLLVVFVEDGQSYLGKLERKYPRLFSLVDEAERSELLAGGDPVRVWSNVFPRSLVGTPVYRRGGKWVVPNNKGSKSMMLPSRTDIDSAVVVFDSEAVVGMSTVQLADYATMRGLAHTRPADGGEPLETILGLFAPDSGWKPDQLTSFDVGYLKSLYWWEANVPAVDKLLGVRKRAKKAREGEPPS
jgi:hypothetical protein